MGTWWRRSWTWLQSVTLSITLHSVPWGSVVSARAQQQVPERPLYQIEATYHPAQRDVVGHMSVTLPAFEAKGEHAFFRLYPNAFWRWAHESATKPTKPGFLMVGEVRVNGKQAQAQFLRDHTVLQVHMPSHQEGEQEEAQRNEQVRIVEMDYHLRLPEGGLRLTQQGRTAFLAQWYPMLAVRDKNGWHTDPYTTTGDPFYSRTADFRVSFHLPSGYRIASTGKNPEPTPEGVATVTQDHVRDFVAVLTADYKVLSAPADPVSTRVNLWYRPDMEKVAPTLHQAAIKSLQFYSDQFGAYPYDEVDVVLEEGSHGIAGMEYPGLITSMPQTEGENGEEPAVHVVAHEMAHQWWYALVGNDQAREPWLDEGVTTFCEFLYMREAEKKDGVPFLRQAAERADRIHQRTKLAVTEPVYRYPDSFYALMVYLRPAAMFFALAQQVGMDQVLHLLRLYHDRYRHKIATGCDFVALTNQVLQRDMHDFFRKWLYKVPCNPGDNR